MGELPLFLEGEIRLTSKRVFFREQNKRRRFLLKLASQKAYMIGLKMELVREKQSKRGLNGKFPEAFSRR